MRNWYYTIGVCFLFAILTFWKIFEYDLMWQIRAGEEILKSFSVQTTDSWSHAVPTGTTWINFQWLSCVFAYLFYNIAGFESFYGIQFLHFILIFLWVFGFCICLKVWVKEEKYPIALFLFIPLIWLAGVFRLQMRPDMYALVIYGFLFYIWFKDNKSFQWKFWVGIALLLLWSNFHSGTVTIGIFTHIVFTLFAGPLHFSQILRFALTFVVWFMTPQGLNVITVFRQQVLSYNWANTGNPDQQPFSASIMGFATGGYSPGVWLLLVCLAIMFFVVDFSRRWKESGGNIFKTVKAIDVIFVILTLASLQKIRVFPYQTVAMMYYISQAFNHSFYLNIQGKDYQFIRNKAFQMVVLIGIFLVYFLMIKRQVLYCNRPLGFGLSEKDFPIYTTRFLKKTQPQGIMWNDYMFGGYFIQFLREYKVSFDGREIPFLNLIKEYRDAQREAVSYQNFMVKYNTDILVMETLSHMMGPEQQFINRQRLYAPKEEWALVYFDNASVVYLRRSEKNSKIIEEHEYKFLERGLPSTLVYNYAKQSGTSTNTYENVMMEKEFDRCLADNPKNIFCLQGKAAFHQIRKEYPQAVDLLETAYQENTLMIETVIQYAEALQSAGRVGDSRKMFQEFDKLSNP